MLNAGDSPHPRFVLRRVLGRGGMAEVWLADDLERQRPSALKFLRDGVGDAAECAALLDHEADCMRRVQHPAVPRVIGRFQSRDGAGFLALEAVLVEEALQPRSLNSLRGAPVHDWIGATVALCDALVAVHAAGVVHRDVKAANVLLGTGGRISIIDFGVAAALQDAAPAQALRSGGSPQSMSPQQRDGEVPTPADDIYAVGVLLHELAYSHAPAALVAAPGPGEEEDPAAPPLPRSPALPEALVKLIGACLAPAPADRPQDMATLRAALTEIADAVLNITQPPAGISALRAAERIVPVSPRNAALAALQPTVATGRRAGGFPWRVLAGVSAVWMVALAAVVLTRLPVASVPAAAAVAQKRPTSSGRGDAPTPQQAITAPFEYARLSRERADLLDEVNRVLDVKARLEARSVERWGGDDWAAALAQAQAGDAQFRENDFAAAAVSYTAAEEAMLALEEMVPGVAAAALERGEAALERGDGTEAIAQFELALAVDDSLTQATRGIERAGNLDDVASLLAQAREAEGAGDAATAIRRYEEALALDPDLRGARTAVSDLRAAQADSRFDRLMSDGFTALDREDYAAARKAFEAAGRLQPRSEVVGDALAQVEVASRGKRIAELRAQAEGYAADEQWTQAKEAYRAVLAIDPNLLFAQNGVREADTLAELNERLQFYASDPLRLTDRNVRQRALDVLAQASAITDPGPRLAERREQLSEAIESLTRPVTIRFRSDNKTSVRILRAADLGRFDAREVPLRPGRYTIVGTRDGYRDVREEITVLANDGERVVDVRCRERI
jgi:tetratricopeptide (TPR) repeat protein